MKAEKRFNVTEFSCIILAAESEIYPILSNKHTLGALPIGNIPLIHWQLDFLGDSGFESCIIVTYEEQSQETQNLVNEWLTYKKYPKFNLRFFQIPRSMSEVEALAKIGTRITSDCLILGANFLSSVPITHLADIHRVQDSTVTLAVRDPGCTISHSRRAVDKESEDAWDRMCEENIDSPLRLFLGVHESEKRHEVCHRVLLYDHHWQGLQDNDNSDSFRIPKEILRHHPLIKIFIDLSPCRAAVLSSWVMRWLADHPDLKGNDLYSVWNDLIPVLVASQCTEDPTMERFETRADETSLFQAYSTGSQIGESLTAYKDRKKHRRKCFVYFHPESDLESLVWDWKSFRKLNFTILRGSISKRFQLAVEDRDRKDKMQAKAHRSGNPVHIHSKKSDVKDMDDDSSTCQSDAEITAIGSTEVSKCYESIFGDNVDIGRGCTIKWSIIGANCKIGAHCELDHCLLLEGVTIKEGTVMENTIVSFKSTVGSNCTLRECVVGFEQNVPPGCESYMETFDETIGIKEFGVRVGT